MVSIPFSSDGEEIWREKVWLIPYILVSLLFIVSVYGTIGLIKEGIKWFMQKILSLYAK